MGNKILRWCIWFFIGNSILFWLIGLNYLSTIPWLHSIYLIPKWRYELYFFVTVSYLGQLGLLAILPCIFSIIFVLFSIPKKYIFSLAVLLATISASLLLVDTFIYNLYRFHLNGVIFHFILSGLNKQFFDFSKHEFILMIFVVITILLLECVYAWTVWIFIVSKKRWIGMGKWFGILLGFCIYLSYMMILFSAGLALNRVLVESTRFLPFYTTFFSSFFPGNDLSVTMARIGEINLEHSRRTDLQLRYPIEKLQFKKTEKLNIVIILIDAWRFDMLDADVTPSLYDFAKHSNYFSNHFSGGNATGPGIFSLFYGIPASYWSVMESHERGPLLIDELINQHYSVGIFSSGTLKLPAFNKTVFARFKNSLKEPQGTPYQRDKIVTSRFLKFINQVKQPFFSYIHLESAHSFCSLENNLLPFQPVVHDCDRAKLTNESDPIPYFNRYKNALLLVDQQIKLILMEIKRLHLLDKTVIIVTGDHGEEFNDNHQGYWSHASNYSAYQVRTPLIIYWPGIKSRVFNHKTSHYDIAPTLMNRVLGCKTKMSSYSSGKDLFDPNSFPYLLVEGYIDFGILEKDRITRVFSTGDYQVEKLNSEPSSMRLNLPVLSQAFIEMRRFYKIDIP